MNIELCVSANLHSIQRPLDSLNFELHTSQLLGLLCHLVISSLSEYELGKNLFVALEAPLSVHIRKVGSRVGSGGPVIFTAYPHLILFWLLNLLQSEVGTLPQVSDFHLYTSLVSSCDYHIISIGICQ